MEKACDSSKHDFLTRQTRAGIINHFNLELPATDELPTIAIRIMQEMLHIA